MNRHGDPKTNHYAPPETATRLLAKPCATGRVAHR